MGFFKTHTEGKIREKVLAVRSNSKTIRFFHGTSSWCYRQKWRLKGKDQFAQLDKKGAIAREKSWQKNS